MTEKIDLSNDAIKTSFFRYLVPAIFAMVIRSVLVVVDSMFIGRGIGAMGLGAVSMTMPVSAVVGAISLMIGVGGATRMAVQFGKGNRREGQVIFAQSVAFALLLASVAVVAALFWQEEIIGLMGASGELARLAGDYLGVVLPFLMVHVVMLLLFCFIRNDTNPTLPMYAMACGVLANIALDYLFIFRFGWGIRGAALAGGLAQSFMVCILLTHFFSGRGVLKLSLRGAGFGKIPGILHIGMPVFFIETTAAVSVMAFNYVLVNRYGDLHVAAYGIVMNTGMVVLFLLAGVGEACQPIMSFNHGAGKALRVREIVSLGLRWAVGTGLLIAGGMTLGAEWIASLFTEDNRPLIDLSATAIRIYFLAPPLIGVNVIVSTLFQATENARTATLLSLSRGCVLVVAGLMVLPLLFPERGVWGSVLFAESITAAMSLKLLGRHLAGQRLPDTAMIRELDLNEN